MLLPESYVLDGRAQATGIRKSSKDATLLLVINGHSDLVKFTQPECYGGMQWSTAEMLKRFENGQAVAAAEKEFNEAQEIEAAFDRDLMDSMRLELL